jgi:hypothetical protein
MSGEIKEKNTIEQEDQGERQEEKKKRKRRGEN